MRNDFHDTERFENNENKDINTERDGNGTVEDDFEYRAREEAAEEEYREDEKSPSSEGTPYSEKEEAHKEEGEAFEKKKNAYFEKEEFSREEPWTGNDIRNGDNGEEVRGNRSYAPPYHSSNYAQADGKERVKKQKRGRGAFISAMVALLLVVAVLLATLLPALLVNVGVVAIGSIWQLGDVLDGVFDIQIIDGSNQNEAEGDPSQNYLPDEDINVTKNDGSININEQIGSTGYSGDLSIAEVVELVADTVVEITTTNVVTDRFYGQYVTSGAGSGVIISGNGYIITNYHVIEGAKTITVRLTDGSEFSARVVGSDSNTDVALLKISASGLPAAVLGNSGKLVVGQEVVAIGNPLGSLGGTVTDGIISALDRTVVIDGNTMTLMRRYKSG